VNPKKIFIELSLLQRPNIPRLRLCRKPRGVQLQIFFVPLERVNPRDVVENVPVLNKAIRVKVWTPIQHKQHFLVLAMLGAV